MKFSVRCFLSVVAASILLSFVAVHASFLSQSSKSSRRFGVGSTRSGGSSHTSSMTTTTLLNLQDSDNNDNDDDMLWTPLDPESLVAAPCLIEQTLCQASETAPRLSKDYDYAAAVLDVWKQQEADADHPWSTETRPVAYSYASTDDTTDDSTTTQTTLYGHLVRRRRPRPGEESTTTTTAPSTPSTASNIPGIVFFHTGAGPHDIFLLWKAAALVNSMMMDDDTTTDTDGNGENDGPVILIADILSDATGWAWDDDKTHYQAERDAVLGTVAGNEHEHDSHQYRPVLQQRIRAAIDTLLKVDPRVDPENLAALGWCLGGHSVLELGRMQVQDQQLPWRMRAMVTFHGVFDGLPPPAAAAAAAAAMDNDNENENPDDNDTDAYVDTTQKKTEILLCHGTEDPFVSDQSLERALATLTVNRHIVSLLQLSGAKHGFTNPAQDFNDNPAFAFDAVSADKAWRQTMALLRRACA
jgi:dienelactone hydrolase